MPAPPFQHGFANDVFISYTHEDDNEEAGIRWVSRFAEEFRSRLAKVTGHSIRAWRDDRLTGAERFKPEIEEQLLTSAVLVAVVTPSYFRSPWCSAEREQFIAHARAQRGLDVGNSARIVKVAKTPVPLEHYPPELRELLEFRFYAEEANGRAREFHLSPEPLTQRRFYTVVDDMAQAIDKILSGLETGAPVVSKGFVYLGESSSDIDGDRDQLRRSLVHRGYTVLPESPLRLRSGPAVEQVVQRDLGQCRLAVYPIGAYYGPVLEGSGDRSITELQLEAALRDARNGQVGRMVWVPRGIEISEGRQRQLLSRIRTELPSRGFEVVESPLTEIETHIKDRLEPPARSVAVSVESDERPEIYLICLPGDREAARALQECLFAEGYEVRLPPTSDEHYAALHLRRLESADAFVVFWGHADESWIEPVITDLKKAKARKGKRVLARAIYLADPRTTEKRDFTTHHAMLLSGDVDRTVKDALQPLLESIRTSDPQSPR